MNNKVQTVTVTIKSYQIKCVYCIEKTVYTEYKMYV